MSRLNLGGGDITPYLKFNSKAGRWYIKEGQKDVEIVNPTFVADLYNLATGWFKFQEGSAPSRIMDPNILTAAPAPEDKGYKRGFILKLMLDGRDGVFELSSTSGLVRKAIDSLLDDFERGYHQHYGELPVVVVKGVEPKKGMHGVNYRPVFAISCWVERPDELVDESLWADGTSIYCRDATPPALLNDTIPF
jgi:hypothetical protein